MSLHPSESARFTVVVDLVGRVSSSEMDTGSSARKKAFPASPALSLSLAGVFRNAAAAVEEGGLEGEGSGGGGAAVEVSSENTGPGRSEDDGEEGMGEEDEGEEEEGEEGNGGGTKKKKRKMSTKYHRHTAEQIKVMEAVFRETPHPDEIQRQQLSKRLGLAPRQVKFWFQNRRTQIKAIQERHENTLLKSEIEKLREENRYMREAMKKGNYSTSVPMATSKESSVMTEDQQLRIENMKLKSEIEKLRGLVGRLQQRSSTSSSMSDGPDPRGNLLNYSSGLYGLDEVRIQETVTAAMDELMKMAALNDPLWIRSIETGREILNYDEYVRAFLPSGTSPRSQAGQSVEASRETGIVFLEISRLIQAFMDVNEWKDMFPSMISRAAVVEVISNGDGRTKDGAIQLMIAEHQLPTPLVATREAHFLRYCKRHATDRWAVVDLSVDRLLDDSSVVEPSAAIRCRKLPSGCVIQDTANGHCKVTWVEHTESQLKGSATHTLFRPLMASGMAFGARRWMATLQQQCERRVFFMATNVPTRDCNGVSTLAGRRSLLTLAQRMTRGFCESLGASSGRKWRKVAAKGGEETRVSSRKSSSDPGEPIGLISCAVSSTWLAATPVTLFNFLRDESRRTEWDVLFDGALLNPIATIVKGQDRGNSLVVLASNDNQTKTWLLQDSCTTSTYEATVVFAAVDVGRMQSVMAGCSSGSVDILPMGFSILPDGLEARPSVIMASRTAEEVGTERSGSLLTVAIQVLADTSAADPIDAVSAVVSCTVQNIKRAMQCEDC